MLKKILLSVLAIFGLTFFFGSNTYAIDDFQLVWTSSDVPSYQSICGGSSDRQCSDYSFIVITQTFPSDYSYVVDGNHSPFISFSFNSIYNSSIPLPLYSSPIAFSISSDLTSLSYNSSYQLSDYLASGVTVTLTLTNFSPFASSDVPSGSLSITSNGTYDVTNYATAVVDVSTTNTWVVELFKDGFWGIMTALVALIVPVLVLFLVFRLVHDWLWGKG